MRTAEDTDEPAPGPDARYAGTAQPLVRSRKQRSAVRITALSACGGLLVFLSDSPVHAWPLQIIALVPLLWALTRHCERSRCAAWAGLCFGTAYLVPTQLTLELPLAIGLPLGAYLVALWVAFSVAAHHVLRWPACWGALGAGAAAVVVEWVDISLVPIWGTAQVFTRVWSAAPWAIQITSLTGVLGLVFVVVTVQALAVTLVHAPRKRIPAIVALTVLLMASGGYSLWSWSQPALGSIRVAAVGWPHDPTARLRRDSLSSFSSTFVPQARAAAQQGARLVVSPETAARPDPEQVPLLLDQVATLARELRVMVALGYFDPTRRQNLLALFDETGKQVGEYAKTHLIFLLERYEPGTGSLMTFDNDGIRIGGMICQDDNFTDLSRRYAQAHAQLMIVPTNDWEQVKDHHFENSVFRAVESGYGLVRAATGGVSAVVSARGQVRARMDHTTEGPGLVVADLPIYPGGTPYGMLGNWLAVASMLGLSCGLIRFWTSRRTARE